MGASLLLAACVGCSAPASSTGLQAPAGDGDAGQFDVLGADASADAGSDSAIDTVPASTPSLGVTVDAANALHFGGVQLGKSVTATVTLHANGNAAVEVTRIALADASAPFTLDFAAMHAASPAVDAVAGPTPAAPLTLVPGAKVTFVVVFSPDMVGSEGTSLQIDASVPTQALPVDGAGVQTSCPIAKMAVKEGGAVIPQTTLHLQSTGSAGEDGSSPAKVQWTVKQPVGSKQVFAPGSQSPSPTFTVKVAGDYEFCLEIWDQTGGKNCVPACTTVHVVPDDAVHVELVWDTPAAAKPGGVNAGAGADLDLHFAHVLASGPDFDCDGKGDPWFSNPFDTFWLNPNPNWGNAIPTVPDDPNLDLDDANSAAPEILDLANPEGSSDKPEFYHVGVHAWNDNGFGVSYATIRVYVFGTLATELAKVPMDARAMWYVGKVHWPNTISDAGASTVEAFETCYQSGDPCMGGKRWQPNGEYCVKGCYVNPMFTTKPTDILPAVCP